MFKLGADANASYPKSRSVTFTVTVLAVFFVSCLPAALQAQANTDTLRILPLGDSRVAGASPAYESYRYELWKALVDGGWAFDFVGAHEDPVSYPPFMDAEFDPDHNGVGGRRTQDILDNIENELPAFQTADIVLLGIGGNDLRDQLWVSEVIDNIEQIVDILRRENADVTIYLEQIAPAMSASMTPASIRILEQFNEAVAEYAASQSTDRSRLFPVDMASDWTDDYMADALHYNEAGAKAIADRYFEALSETNGHSTSRDDEPGVRPQSEITLFPNPAQGQVFVSIPSEAIGLVNLQVFDVQGRVAARAQVAHTGASALHSLDVSTLQSGMYFVSVLDPDGGRQYVKSVMVSGQP